MLRLYVASANFKASALDALRKFRDDTSGVTAIEYGLIAGAIAVAIIATVIALGGDIKNLFATTGNALNSTTGSSL
jgi:pilus assembly protein Flp/PilA